MLSSRADVRALLDELNAVSVTKVTKPWGYEYTLQIDQLVIKLIQVFPGAKTSLQHHERKDEIIYILEGGGTLQGSADERKAQPLRPSPGHRIMPSALHRAVGPLIMLEISTNDLDDVVRHQDDYGRTTDTLPFNPQDGP